jgi:hypothetical protein
MRSGLALAVVLAAFAGLSASQASADLVLDVRTAAGVNNALVAIPVGSPAGKWTIPSIQLWATVSGTDPLNAINKVFYSVYSSSATTSTPAAGLTRVNLTTFVSTAASYGWQTQPIQQGSFNEDDGVWVPFMQTFSYAGAPVGTATNPPTAGDLDADGDNDLGTTGTQAQNGSAFWGAVDASQKTYDKYNPDGTPAGGQDIASYFGTSGGNFTKTVQLGTLTINRNNYSSQPYGHGITQIFMVGKSTESDWYDNGAEVFSGTPTQGSKLTLYQTGSAVNGSLSQVDINVATPSGSLVGAGSLGSMNDWKWQVRPHAGGAWQDLADAGNNDTYVLTMAYLASLNGGAGLPFGLYDLQLVTSWDPNGVGGMGISGIPNSTSGMTLLNYTPEPGTMLFLAAGSAGLAFIRRRRSKK